LRMQAEEHEVLRRLSGMGEFESVKRGSGNTIT